jgi:nitrogen fixation NifU-like protein
MSEEVTVSVDWQKYQELSETAIKQVYSETVLDHGRNPRNLGILGETNAFGIVDGPCGDTMAMWLKVEGDKITETSFTTDGCMTSLAAGSMATELVKGKTIDYARKISQQDVLDALGSLPEDSQHCALLAANAVKEAVRDYLASKK